MGQAFYLAVAAGFLAAAPRMTRQDNTQELARLPLPGGRSIRLLLSDAVPTQKMIGQLVRPLVRAANFRHPVPNSDSTGQQVLS